MEQKFLFSLGKRVYNTDKKFSKKIGVLIPTKNRPEVLKKHLKSLGKSYVSSGLELIVFDSSEHDEVKNLCEEFNRKQNLKIRYERYVDVDSKSLDGKVIAGIKKFAPDYEYFWIFRDRMGYLVDAIIDDFNPKLNENYDVIVLNNISDDKKPNRECLNNPKELFKLNFNNMTTLGKIVYKSDFLLNLINANPVDEKNYTLSLPTLIFQYIYNKPFKAYTIIEDCMIYTIEAKKSSFWMSFFLYQMVERMSFILRNLPEIYQSEMNYVIEDFNQRFRLYSLQNLYNASGYESFTLEYVRKLKNDIKFISKTPFEFFEKFALAEGDVYKRLLVFANTDRYNELSFRELLRLKIDRKLPKFRLLIKNKDVNFYSAVLSFVPRSLLKVAQKLYVNYIKK